MTRRHWWGIAFLGVTAVAIGMELWASFDGEDDTIPWTEYIVGHVPLEVTVAAIGALTLWLLVHFGLRYWRKAKGDPGKLMGDVAVVPKPGSEGVTGAATAAAAAEKKVEKTAEPEDKAPQA